MNEEIKGKLISSCNRISNETPNLSKVKQKIVSAGDLCTKEVISINDMNMKESIEALSEDIDKITNETKSFIKNIEEEIMVMSKVV